MTKVGPLFQCNGKPYFYESSPLKTSSCTVQSSKVYQHSSMQIQVHFCSQITNEAMIRKALGKIKEKLPFPSLKYQPYAWRIKNKDSDLILEEYKDKGCTGAGNKLLRILRKRKITDSLICVSVWYTIIPLNFMLDHSPIISAVCNYLNSQNINQSFSLGHSKARNETPLSQTAKIATLFPTIFSNGRKLVFKKPDKSLVSKVLNLTLLQSKSFENNHEINDREQLKGFLKRIEPRDLVLLKVSRKMPNPFVIRVFKVFACLKGEKAEKWSEIQEAIKPASFKMELWKLSHKRIDPFKLQVLHKLVADLDKFNEKVGELYPLTVTLLDWIKWILEKESRGKKIGRIAKYGIPLTNIATPSAEDKRRYMELSGRNITALNAITPCGVSLMKKSRGLANCTDAYSNGKEACIDKCSNSYCY